MLAHASLHDAAEVLCSDVVTPVKKANAVLQREFERLEKAAEDKLIQTLPAELQDAVAIAFAPGGYEQSLVKACDTTLLTSSANLRWPQVMGLSSRMRLAKWSLLLLR
nr:YfbR-like 5'-deoxynucleotidase [Photorhabdus temperata]